MPLVLRLLIASLPLLCVLTQAAGQDHPVRGEDLAVVELRERLADLENDGDVDAYARTAEKLSEAYIGQGVFQKAMELYRDAAQYCFEQEAYGWFARFNRNIAEIDFMMGKRDDAYIILDSLASMREIPGDEMTAILFRLGDIECDQGNYDKGIEHLNHSLALADETGYERLLGSIYTELGMCTKVIGRKVAAVDYLIAAIPYLQAPKHSRVLGHNYLIIAGLFEETGQPEKADEYRAKAKAIAEEKNYTRLWHRVLYREGMRDLRLGNTDGFDKLKEVIQFYDETDRRERYAGVSLDLAAEYLRMGYYEAAKPYLEQSASVLKELNDPIQTTKYFEHLTRYRLTSGDIQGARESYNVNAQLVDSVGGKTLRLRSTALHVDLLKAEGRYREALELSQFYHELKDSLNSVEQNQVLFDIEARYQKEENEKTIELLSAQNQIKELEIQRASRRNMALLLGLFGIGLIALVSIYSIRLKQRTNKQLAERNAIISKNLSEKELLLREIHHRVKNNLEVISGLLYLQSKYVEDENVLEAIREGQNRVRSMSLIHKNLYQDDNLTGIEIDGYLNKLIDSLMRSYKIGDNKITVKKDITPLNLDVDTVIPLALIINELISNALKYAFPGNASGELDVVLQEEQQQLVLTVSDNGIGMPEGFDPASSNSLGFKLVDLFTKKLDGTIAIFNENGTRVVLKMAQYKAL